MNDKRDLGTVNEEEEVSIFRILFLHNGSVRGECFYQESSYFYSSDFLNEHYAFFEEFENGMKKSHWWVVEEFFTKEGRLVVITARKKED